jgi:fatty acid desaturase
MYWASHQEHHKYTLHPPDDQEVTLPANLTLKAFQNTAVVNPWNFILHLKYTIRVARGRIEGRWEERLFPVGAVHQRRRLFGWARVVLFGHLLIAAVSLYFGLWLVPLLVTVAPFYGGLLYYCCIVTQHSGLQDNVPDFRLCTRSIKVNPVLQFLYWHMNYHIEHHMYAAVPCYNLGRLSREIKDDLPTPPVSLIAALKEIIGITLIQNVNPTWQHVVQLPTRHAK